MEPVEIVLEEYRTLRAEALASVDRQQRIIATGTAVAGVVLGLDAKADPGGTESWVILLVLAPLLACSTVALWIGEVERQIVLGARLATVEARVTQLSPDPGLELLGSETHQRAKKPRGRRVHGDYHGAFIVLWTLAAAAALLGATRLLDHPGFGRVVGVVAAAGLLVLLGLFYGGSMLRLRSVISRNWTGWRRRLMRIAGGPLNRPGTSEHSKDGPPRSETGECRSARERAASCGRADGTTTCLGS
jgi:hypothetical protein